MNFFSFTHNIAIDLGTANTIIIHNNKTVVDEPSVIAIDKNSKKLLAVGKEAEQMEGKTHDNIRVVRPLRDGVIADFHATELMLKGLIKMLGKHSHIFPISLKIVVCIPSGSTEVEIRAVRDSASNSGGHHIYMIYEPMAAALGIGLDIEAPEGNMILDIGGGTTEIAVLALGGIVSNMSIRVAGNDLTQDIIEYIKKQYNIGERTAEKIKINVGAAMSNLEEPLEDFIFYAPDTINALPKKIVVSYQEISYCLEKTIMKIENAIRSALESTPPELYTDIVQNGIYLAGGGALLKGIAQRFLNKMHLTFHVADNPLHAVARGTGLALKNTDKYKFLLR